MSSNTSTRHSETENHGVMLGMITGYWVSQIVGAYANLSIPEHLHGQSRTPEEIAKAEDADPAAVRRLLAAGVTLGLVTTEDGRYRGTSLLNTLRDGAPNSLRHLAQVLTEPGHWLTWGGFTDAVREGGSQAVKALGMDIFDYFGVNGREAGLFSTAMTDLSTPVIVESVPVIDIRPGQVVADLGAANGAFVRALLDHNPEASGVLFDLPHVVAGGAAEVEGYGLSDRLSSVAGNFFESVPAADVYLLKYILHDWDDEACVTILERCRESLSDGGKVVVVDIVLGPDEAPGAGTLMDLNMLAMTKGRERGLEELDGLLARAGLKRTSVTTVQAPYAVIEATAV
ncbi:methyltransferase [Umezawaea sp. NPDC059074]|uniref:methyltransferase n=1 Tax=Umezawaea sp. NPDC059074 TaxID=3346716 RepID=UPI0036A79CCD